MSKLRLGASHTCTRTHARIYKRRTIKCDPSGACIRTLRVRFNEPGSEADRALRKRKKQCVRMHLRCIRLNLTSFGPLHGPLRLRSAPRLRAPFGRKKKKKNHDPATSRGTLRPHHQPSNRPQPPTPFPMCVQVAGLILT